MLNKIHFQSTYFKTRNELYEEFYKPCMENSIRYDRISGYFGSSVFLVINQALKTFINNKGHIRIICSPVLKGEDIDAIKKGYTDKELNNIATNLNDIIDELSKVNPSGTKLLSKLISSGILEIRLSVFGDNLQAGRLMHDKAGVFLDGENNAVAFRGSINETYKGLSEYGNSESFDVFTSWEDKKDKERVELVINQFNNMWNNIEPNIVTFEIPKITIEKINSFATDKTIDELIDEVAVVTARKKLKWYAESGEKQRIIKPHQELILNNWVSNGRKGIFEMCTGSGKTFTALCAIREAVLEKNEVPIIIVPSKLLFNQWKKEIENIFLGQVPILAIGAGSSLKTSKLRMYTRGNVNTPRCIITTYQSASKDLFIDNVMQGEHIFLICDEVHNVGSEQNSKILNLNVGPRIGLSATPKRYFDDIGTKRIIKYFDGIIEPKYLLAQAIAEGVLCPYFYSIREIQLLKDEQDEWNRLSKLISRKFSMESKIDNIKDNIDLDKLLFKRADIVKKAKNKISVAVDILLNHYQPNQKWLIYLDDVSQVKELKQSLSKYKVFLGNVFEYHTKTDGDLPQTIEYFEKNGAILLSINCLDEGVDIPSIDHAIILASSKNPRQYIQRRGRVLRKSKNKSFAYIYDCLVSPHLLEKDNEKSLSIIRGEIVRALEFAETAENNELVKNKLIIIMNINNIDISEGESGENE